MSPTAPVDQDWPAAHSISSYVVSPLNRAQIYLYDEIRVCSACIIACSSTIPSRRLQFNASVAYPNADVELPRCSSNNASLVKSVVIVPLPPNSLKKLRH